MKRTWSHSNPSYQIVMREGDNTPTFNDPRIEEATQKMIEGGGVVLAYFDPEAGGIRILHTHDRPKEIVPEFERTLMDEWGAGKTLVEALRGILGAYWGHVEDFDASPDPYEAEFGWKIPPLQNTTATSNNKEANT